MRVVVFGATGGTGAQVVRQALGAGHEVVAVARDPSRVALTHQRLRVTQGDVLDPGSIRPAVAGAGAVVSAIGPRSLRADPTVLSVGTDNVVEAMRAADVRRLLIVTATPVAPPDPADSLPYRLLVKPLLWRIFGRLYAEMARAEGAVRRSGLEWTILRPPRLTDKPRTGHYRVAFQGSVPGGYFISRADLADAILRFVGDPQAINAAVAVGY
jgi:putative NADH-flavin reductase